MNSLQKILVHVWSKFRYASRGVIERNSVVLGNSLFEGGNKISPDSYISETKLGFGTYIGSHCHFSNVEIGRFTSIGDNVKLISSQHPTEVFASTSPCFYSKNNYLHWIQNDKYSEYLVNSNGKALSIGNDVWIGSNVLIKGGISIGNGAVIAMGSVVTKDVPDYAIVGGVPAKLIRFRFDENQRKELLTNPWWNESIDWIKENMDVFDNVDELLKLLCGGSDESL